MNRESWILFGAILKLIRTLSLSGNSEKERSSATLSSLGERFSMESRITLNTEPDHPTG
jgi:hypothetical protein